MDEIINILKADSEVIIAAFAIIVFFVLVKFFTNLVIKIGMGITILYTIYFFTLMGEDSKNKVRSIVSNYQENVKEMNVNIDFKEYFNKFNIEKSLENVKTKDISLSKRLEEIVKDNKVDDKELKELFEINNLNKEKINDLNKIIEPLKELYVH